MYPSVWVTMFADIWESVIDMRFMPSGHLMPSRRRFESF